MDNINDLIGDAAKQLMAQADGIQNQKLKASAQRVAQTISAKTRDELISVARSDAYGRDTRFIKYLPITWRQKAVMGRVYSFQCTTNKDGTPGEFRMSLATAVYLSSLEGSREERAFELAKNEYLAWLEHKADRYTTVYGYMGLGDRYEQHLL